MVILYDTSLDQTDLAVLHCVKEETLWKNKIHNRIEERLESLPVTAVPSIQTIGRRVDSLHNEEYLATSIMSSDEVKRDLIIGYRLTDKGREAMQKAQDTLLHRIVQQALFKNEKQTEIGKHALVTVIADQFGYPEEIVNCLLEEYSEEEIVTLLAIEFIDKEASTILGGKEPVQQWHNVVLDGEQLTTFFTP